MSSIPTTPTSIESLAANCYLDVSELTFHNIGYSHWCQVCKCHKVDACRGYCYNNHGTNRQEIIICRTCLAMYKEAAGIHPSIGVRSVTALYDDEREILSVLKSMKANDKAAADADFFEAAKIAYDKNQLVRERYFDNKYSRIRPDNKALWPLRYEAYKQFGV